MTHPAYPETEAQRLADLHAHKLLDSGPDSAFDGLTRLAADLMGVPVAAVSLIDADRQWFKSCVGLDVAQTPRSVAVCHHTIAQRSTLVVNDLSKDPRFAANPVVTEDPHLRFYAGVPLFSAAGHALGALCVIDTRPRFPGPGELERLEALAEQAIRLIELHRDVLDAEEAAYTDPRTGLDNECGLLRRIDAALSAGSGVLVASVRLDRFEAIAGGSSAGEAVVAETAVRLRTLLDASLPGVSEGTERTLARLHGGTFALLLDGRMDSSSAAVGLAGLVHEAMSQVFEHGGERISLSVTVGLAERARGGGRPAGMPRVNTGAELLARAVLAMSEADHGTAEGGAGAAGCTSRVFDARLLQRVRRGVRIESDLREALADGQIRPALQPIIDLNDSTVIGFEALARWTHPVHGPIAPTHFVPLAERLGLVDDLFDAVAGGALAGLAATGGGRGINRYVSLNLSKLQLRDDGLEHRILAHAEAAGLTPAHVHLELTESDVADCPEAVGTMHRLRAAGFELMLDDFGTGTSTLSGLHSYPVQWLKIDRAFSAEAVKNRTVAVVADAVADLARKLGMRTVAEGIEQPEEAPMFQAMGFDAGQGWLFGKPMPASDVAGWLARGGTEGKPRRAAA